MVDTARSLDSSVDYDNGGGGAHGIARGSVYQQHLWNCDPQMATSRSWEDDDAIVARRSSDEYTPTNVVNPAFSNVSNEGSMSTMLNTNRQEDCSR